MMEKIEILTRFPGKEMTTMEFITFCKYILQSFQKFAPDIATVGIWSDAINADYYFDSELSGFENTIFKEIQIETKDYSFINEDVKDKNLYFDSKNYGSFSFSFSLHNVNTKKETLLVMIEAGNVNEVGLLNIEFPNAIQKNITLIQMLPLLEFTISLVHPVYITASSFELRKNISKKEDDIELGWITYLSDKRAFDLLPLTVGKKKVDGGGVLFWLSDEKVLGTNETEVQKALAIRSIFIDNGMLNYS